MLTYNAKFVPNMDTLHSLAGINLIRIINLLLWLVTPLTQQWLSSPYGYNSFPQNVWTRPPMQPRSVANFSHAPSAFVANSVPSSSASWFPDFSASFHVTNDAKNIQLLAPFEGPD